VAEERVSGSAVDPQSVLPDVDGFRDVSYADITLQCVGGLGSAIDPARIAYFAPGTSFNSSQFIFECHFYSTV